MTTPDAFPNITTDQLEGDTDGLFKPLPRATPEEVQAQIGRLYEARQHLEAIRDSSHRSNYDFPEGTYLAKIHADAVDAIEIIDSLRWLWDELVPSADWIAKHEGGA